MRETLAPLIFSEAQANCILLVDSRFLENTGDREWMDDGMERNDEDAMGWRAVLTGDYTLRMSEGTRCGRARISAFPNRPWAGHKHKK